AWQMKLHVLCKLGRWEEALKTAEASAERLPDDASLRELREWVKQQVRRTAEDHTLMLRDGRRLGYIDIGDPNGAVILGCHGTPGSRLDFAQEDALLRSLGVRLIAPDRPGYGLSDFTRHSYLSWVDDAVELMDSLGIERFAVLGVSGGGPYAAAVAYQIPDRVLRLGLCSSGTPLNTLRAWVHLHWLSWPSHIIARCVPYPLLKRMDDSIAPRLRSDPETYYRLLMRFRVHWGEKTRLSKAPIAPATLDAFAEGYRQGGAGPAWDTHLGVRAWGFASRHLSVETYLWHGSKDILASPAMARVLARAIPNCHATIYPDEGHLVFYQHASEILTTLAGAQASTSSGTPAPTSAAASGAEAV
ncbi:MAG TPA: alpha/beta hydrolase, partial [Ktedonobacterales bacterium]|nr:alpha/beta hydrolase [Ktedonobacterales bacterium]